MLRLFLLILPLGILAQSSDLEIDSIAFNVDLSDLVITGQYSPTHYKNVIHKVDVIDKQMIKGRGALTLEKALSISPAIRIYEDPILGTSIKMRGIGASNVAILIDGVPVIGRQNGAIDLSQIAMQNVKRIEIVEGPLSNIYGSNAAAGVINIITEKTQLKKFRLGSQHQIESVGIKNHQATMGYKWGKLALNVNGRYFKYDQFPSDSLRILVDGSPKFPFNPKVQRSFGSQLRYDFKDDHNLVVKYDQNLEDVSEYGIVRRVQFNPYANDQFYRTLRRDITTIYKHKVNKKFFVDLTSAYNFYDRSRNEKRYYFESDSFDPLLQTTDSTFFRTFFSRLNTSYLINEKFSLMSGGTYSHESGGGDRIVSRLSQDTSKASFQELAIFSEAKYQIVERFQIALSGRWTYHSVYNNRFTPSLQGKLKISEKWSLKGGYAQGYRSPSLKELYLEFIDINHNIVGNPSLQPEVSHDFQSTLSFDSDKAWEASLNAYYTSITNRINLTQTETLKFTYDNIDKYTVLGFQPSVAFKLGTLKVESSASYAFWSTNITDASLPRFGKVFDMNSTFSYTFAEVDLGVLLNHRYVGSEPIYVLSEGSTIVSTVEPYSMMDLSFNRSFFKKRMDIVCGVRNMLDIRTLNVSNGVSSGAHSSAGASAISQGRSFFVQLGIDL